MTASLTDLYRAVKAAFEADALTTAVDFGERAAARQINEATEGANRIVFVPAEGDAVGDVKPGMEGNLGVLWESCVVRVWAHDPDNAEDEAAQYDAARSLFGTLFRALWHTSAGRIQFSKVSRTRARERQYGAEWQFTIRVRDDLVDTPDPTATDLTPDPIILFSLPVATG